MLSCISLHARRGAAAVRGERARCCSRRAEMIAISPPEKKPFPSSSRKIDAAIRRGSGIAKGARFYQTDPRLALSGPYPLW